YLVDFFAKSNEPTIVKTNVVQVESDSLALTIEDKLDKIDFSVRAYNCLRRRGIDTIGDFVELSYEDLVRTRNLGIRNIIEVLVTMYDKGFRLKDCPEEQYPTIESYLLDKVTGGQERILEAFPEGILTIGILQGRKLDFENAKKPNTTVVIEESDDLKKKIEELDAREAELERRAKELAEKEERMLRLEAELGETSTELKAAREKLEELRQENDAKAREAASTLDARERQLALDIQAYTENVALLGQRQAEFDAWAERTRLEIEEEQKKNALTRMVTSLDAIRKMIESQLEEERAYILQGAEAELQRIRAESEALLKTREKEHEATVKAIEKKVDDKTAELDKKIKDINTLVAAMKKVIEDIASVISARVSLLQRTKSQLQTELNAITGMFSTNQRKPIESRIQQIDSEIVALNSLKKLIDDYKEEMKNETMFKAMKSIELSFTPDKPSPKTTSAKMFSFVETATTAAIERFVGFSETEVVIPNTHNGKPVVAIASKAFSKCNSIKKVVLGNNIRKIGDYAFAECDNLECVEATANLTDILTHAFYHCKKLRMFEFGVKLTYIGESAFSETALERVVLPPKVTEIEPFTFYMCPRLKSVILHNNLLVIDSDAFCDCASLEIIEIPKSVQKVAQDAFCGRIYDGLREMRVLSPNTDFSYYGKKLGASLFEGGKKLTVYCYADSKAQAFFREKKVTVKPL
ncbi:MAG: leucine-rich repeat protein, partial [Treponema sp.]|nr:leucine-rich repeat protein [Treponema sp.]